MAGAAVIIDAQPAALREVARRRARDFARGMIGGQEEIVLELTGVERALPVLRDRLADGGILAIMAYHSGEDRLVKHAFREWSALCICPHRQMICTCRGEALGATLTKRPINAASEEVIANPRARSARLRAWKRAG